MPIEFHCSQCGQLLRVPETAAGKRARCPKCQAVMTVPGAASAVPAVNEPSLNAPPPPADVGSSSLPADSAAAPPASNPFSSDHPAIVFPPPPLKPVADDSFAPAGTSADSLNPYASPAPTAYAYPPQFISGGRPGLPWEIEPRSLGCWFRTMSLILGSPTRAFSLMRQYGGFGAPLIYNIYAVGMLMTVLLLVFVPIGLFLVFAAGQDKNRGDLMAGVAIASGVGLIAAAFYGVVLTIVMPAIWSAITHLMLMLYGSARQGFETTFRVICFAYFSVLVPGMFLAIVPYVGGLAMSVWAIVVVIVGLSRAHDISGGKATLAVLTPAFACCGLYLAFAVVFLTAGLSGAFK